MFELSNVKVRLVNFTFLEWKGKKVKIVRHVLTMKKLLSIVQYFYCEFSLSAGSFPSIPLVSRYYNFNDFFAYQNT